MPAFMVWHRLVVAFAFVQIGVGTGDEGFMREEEPYRPTEAERGACPRTIDQAVARLISEMNDADKRRLRKTQKGSLISFHDVWGTGIRNQFGLWRGNTNLMAACGANELDQASMVIIQAV